MVKITRPSLAFEFVGQGGAPDQEAVMTGEDRIHDVDVGEDDDDLPDDVEDDEDDIVDDDFDDDFEDDLETEDLEDDV